MNLDCEARASSENAAESAILRVRSTSLRREQLTIDNLADPEVDHPGCGGFCDRCRRGGLLLLRGLFLLLAFGLGALDSTRRSRGGLSLLLSLLLITDRLGDVGLLDGGLLLLLAGLGFGFRFLDLDVGLDLDEGYVVDVDLDVGGSEEVREGGAQLREGLDVAKVAGEGGVREEGRVRCLGLREWRSEMRS